MANMASSFVGFALFRLAFSFVVGPLVDKYTAQKVLPFTLIPHMFAFVVMLYLDQTWAPFLMFTLFGFGVGAGMNIKGALWPEVYGTEHLGKIRSFITPLAIFATAVGPWVFGWYFSNHTGVEHMVLWSVVAMVLATILVLMARPPKKAGGKP